MICIIFQEWSAEGYQLWMLRESPSPALEQNGNNEISNTRTLIQMDFVKSPLTVNPCMVRFLLKFCFFRKILFYSKKNSLYFIKIIFVNCYFFN